jgi:hypothetical protein
MPVHKSAYAGVWLDLPEACSRDEDAVVRDIALAMDNLAGDELRMALKQIYRKWGDYSGEACDDFIADLMMLGDALRKPARAHRTKPVASNRDASRQGALF